MLRRDAFFQHPHELLPLFHAPPEKEEVKCTHLLPSYIKQKVKGKNLSFNSILCSCIYMSVTSLYPWSKKLSGLACMKRRCKRKENSRYLHNCSEDRVGGLRARSPSSQSNGRDDVAT